MQMICFEIFLKGQMGVLSSETVRSSIVQYKKKWLLDTFL